MTFGLYLLLTLFLLLLVTVWLRSLVVRRLKPERLLGDLRGEVEGLVAELNQTGDRHVSLLEDRINTLHGLIRDADRQIDAIRLALDAAAVADVALETATVPEAEPATDAEVQPDAQPDVQPDAQPEPPPGPTEPVADTVRRLSDQGFSSERIAHSTGMAIGEVELILSLRKGQQWR